MNKPFDLISALKGYDVVTKDGRLVTGLTLFPTDDPCLVGVVSGVITRWFSAGFYQSPLLPNDLDLFMKESLL